jgi:hypothetical protein
VFAGVSAVERGARVSSVAVRGRTTPRLPVASRSAGAKRAPCRAWRADADVFAGVSAVEREALGTLRLVVSEGREQAGLVGEDGGLDAVGEAKTAEDAIDSALHGRLGDVEVFRDLRVGQALADEDEDL